MATPREVMLAGGPDDYEAPLGGFVDWVRGLFGAEPQENPEVQGDPGILGFLDPSGGAAGAAKAGLSMFARPGGPVRGPVTNIAEDIGFLRKVLGDVPMDMVESTLRNARSEGSINAGHRASEVLRNSARANPRNSLERSRLIGAANLAESDRGRSYLEIAELYGGMGPMRATRHADRSAIETLLETLPPIVR